MAPYGGSTVCVHTYLQPTGMQPVHVIFDAGSGIIAFGKSLIQQEPAPVFLFLSHIHLDHIIGIPYCAPFWKPEWKVHMFAGFLHVDGHGGGTAYLKRHIVPPYSQFPLTLSRTNFIARYFCLYNSTWSWI